MQAHDYIRIGKRWAPIALVLAVAAALGAYAFTKYAIHPLYTSTVTMQVQLGLTDQAGNNIDPAFSTSYAQTEAQVASQDPYIRQALAQARTATGINPTPGQLDSVRHSVNCQASPSTSLFSCSVTARDPRFAAAVANALSYVFQLGEQQWEQSRYQDVLNRIAAQEQAARQAKDVARLANLQQLETTTRLAAAQRASIVRVVSPAQPPTSPSSPHRTLNAAIAFFAVLLLVMVVGVITERLDDSVRGEDELKELTDLPLLGTIPAIDSLKGRPLSPASLILSSQPRSPSAEAFRVARTGIAFSRIDDPPRRILVTSTAQGEGKSTFASNVACAYAESGKSTVLVDLDLRRHSLSSLAPARAPGFTNLLLSQDGDPETYLVPGPLPGLRILPTGPLPPSPAEVISSHRMTDMIRRLDSMADVIIVDSPPMLAAADAAITATLCDGVVLLVRPDRITRRTLLRALETLKSVGIPLVGLVVNGVPRSDSRYYSYGYYHDYYGPSGKDQSGGRVPASSDKKRKRIEEAADRIGT